MKRDLQLVKNLYAGKASEVRLPTGTSAWIENRSGVMQGAPESCPIANLVVGALVRVLQSTPRVGFVHHRGCRDFVLGYADDLCLLANSSEEMAALLAQVELFCARAGLELNVAKTTMPLARIYAHKSPSGDSGSPTYPHAPHLNISGASVT